MMSSVPPNLVKEMGDFIDPFVTAIALIKNGDLRNPPGDHIGTGNLLLIDGERYIFTCEHVADLGSQGLLGWTPFGSNAGISIPGKFEVEPYPIDVAVAALSEQSWTLVSHKAQCITPSMFAKIHAPVEGEYLYVYGFPGSGATAAFGQHIIHGTGVITHEGIYDPILATEAPKPVQGTHLCLPYLPEIAKLLQGTHAVLPLANGMSGSLLWNSRYKEVTSQGLSWTPADARVTGIVWGHSQKAGMLIATPVEDFRAFLNI